MQELLRIDLRSGWWPDSLSPNLSLWVAEAGHLETDFLLFTLFELHSSKEQEGPPRWLSGKLANTGYTDPTPLSGRSPGEGNGNTLPYSCLGNPMDWEAWRAAVHKVTKSWTRLSMNSLLASDCWSSPPCPALVLAISPSETHPVRVTRLRERQELGQALWTFALKVYDSVLLF